MMMELQREGGAYLKIAWYNSMLETISFTFLCYDLFNVHGGCSSVGSLPVVCLGVQERDKGTMMTILTCQEVAMVHINLMSGRVHKYSILTRRRLHHVVQ